VKPLLLVRAVVATFIPDTFQPVDASLDRFPGAVEELVSALSARRLPLQEVVEAADRI